MIQIDMPMPDNFYECPLMMHCDDCEGYNNRCALNENIDCGYIVYKDFRTKALAGDHSNGAYTSRHKECPLFETGRIVEVVRCQDCKYSRPYRLDKYTCEKEHDCGDYTVQADWFCADGEKRDE